MINVKTNNRTIVITFVAIVYLGKLSSDVSTAFIPSEFRIFVYEDFTSSDTRHELSGRLSAAFSLLMKSLASLIYDGNCLTIG